MVNATFEYSLIKFLVEASGLISKAVELSFSAKSFRWKAKDSEGRFFLIYQVESKLVANYNVKSDVALEFELAGLRKRLESVSIGPESEKKISIACDSDSDLVFFEFYEPDLNGETVVSIEKSIGEPSEKSHGYIESLKFWDRKTKGWAAAVITFSTKLKETLSKISGEFDVDVSINKDGCYIVESDGPAKGEKRDCSIAVTMNNRDAVCLRGWRMKVMKPLLELITSSADFVRIFAFEKDGGVGDPMEEDDTNPMAEDDTNPMKEDDTWPISNDMYGDTFLEKGAEEGATYPTDEEDSDTSQREIDYPSCSDTNGDDEDSMDGAEDGDYEPDGAEDNDYEPYGAEDDDHELDGADDDDHEPYGAEDDDDELDGADDDDDEPDGAKDGADHEHYEPDDNLTAMIVCIISNPQNGIFKFAVFSDSE